MKKVNICIILLFLAVAGLSAHSPQMCTELFDYYTGIDGRADSIPYGKRAYLRLPRGNKQVKAVLYTHQNMTEEVLFRSEAFTHKMDSMGIAMVFVQSGSQNWDLSVKDTNGRNCQQRFEMVMADLAMISGHQELKDAKIIPFGHSAQATFPWNFAAWNPQRTLCIVSFHGDAPRTNLCGYGRENVEWGRKRNINRIPALMIEGEYEWWEARVNPALAFRIKYPDSRISFLCDAGRGHFDLCEDTQMYVARFIAKAFDYSPVSIVPEGGDSIHDAVANDGVYYSRWFADGHETDDKHDQFWYFDDEMVQWTKNRYKQWLGKKKLYVSATINGKLLQYDANRHVKINAECPGESFTVVPVFVDESRTTIVNMPKSMKKHLRTVLISGPAKALGNNRFEVDPNYFGQDPKRMWTGITLSVEFDGNENYKPAQQEINLNAHF